MAGESTAGHGMNEAFVSELEERIEGIQTEIGMLRGMRETLPRLCTLVEDELMRLQAELDAARMKAASMVNVSQISTLTRSKSAPVHHEMTKRRIRLPVPAEKYPNYNFVGRLLGPRGATLKSLEKETGCRILIRGRGSVRKEKESEVRGKPGWEHLFNEPLHVIIEVDMEDAMAMNALNKAKEAVELLLVPVPDNQDTLKRQQLRDLAILNGTFRETAKSSSGTSPVSLDSFEGGFSLTYSKSMPKPTSLAMPEALFRQKSFALEDGDCMSNVLFVPVGSPARSDSPDQSQEQDPPSYAKLDWVIPATKSTVRWMDEMITSPSERRVRTRTPASTGSFQRIPSIGAADNNYHAAFSCAIEDASHSEL